MNSSEKIRKLETENALLTRLLLEQKNLSSESECAEPPPVLFVDFYQKWLTRQKSQVQSSTFFEYSRIFNHYIVPYFQPLGKTLSDMATHDIIDYYLHLKNTHAMTNNSLIRHHANLYTCFKYAYTEGYLETMIMDKVPRPKENIHHDFNYYTVDELTELFELARGSNIFTPILLAGILGLRRSEVLALKWDAINFLNGTITVKRKMTRDKEKLHDRVSGNLKSNASQRTLVMPTLIVEHLEQLKAGAKFMENRNYLEFVCLDADGALPTLNMVTNRFRDFLQKQGLKKIRYHDLRHSCATMLLALGYSMKEIQKWLGHSSYTTTANIYTHVDLVEKQQMANGLDIALRSSESEGSTPRRETLSRRFCGISSHCGAVIPQSP